MLKVIGKSIAAILVCYVVFLVYANMSRVDSEFTDSYVLNTAKARHELVIAIKKSGIPHRLGGEQRDKVWFKPEDGQKVAELVSALNLIEDPEAANTILYFDSKLTESDAKKVLLTKYPNILDEARMVGPVIAKITSGIEGFAESGEEVWHIRIINNNGGIKALFFVHPQSGKLFELQSPKV